MKKCVIISNYAVNEYRESILKEKIKLFKSLDIDVLLVSSDHIKKYDNVDHYLTLDTKFCTEKYVSDNLHLYVNNHGKNFWYKFPSSTNLHYKTCFETYFIKMYQITINHCYLLGYDFVFFIEFDINFHNQQFIVDACTNVDLSKYYFYKVSDKDDNTSYHGLFFYGNVIELNNIFKESNLKKLSDLCKNENIWSVEHSVWSLIHRNEFGTDKSNFVQKPYLDDTSYVNLFTSNNIAEVFYELSTKKYYFFHSKSWRDHNQNCIGAQLYKEDQLIYSDVLKIDSMCYCCELENDVNYTIKKYDGDICEEKLYTIKQVYTDSSKQSTLYFCT